MRTTVVAESGAKPGGAYSHANVANGFVFLSGQGPASPADGSVSQDFEQQVRQTLSNLRTVLEAAGAGFDNVVKVNAYLADIDTFPVFDRIYAEFFPSRPPARTTVGATLRGIMVEIDCIAALPED